MPSESRYPAVAMRCHDEEYAVINSPKASHHVDPGPAVLDNQQEIGPCNHRKRGLTDHFLESGSRI